MTPRFVHGAGEDVCRLLQGSWFSALLPYSQGLHSAVGRTWQSRARWVGSVTFLGALCFHGKALFACLAIVGGTTPCWQPCSCQGGLTTAGVQHQASPPHPASCCSGFHSLDHGAQGRTAGWGALSPQWPANICPPLLPRALLQLCHPPGSEI